MKRMQSDEKTRREFMRGVLRGAALAGAAVFSAAMLLRKRSAPTEDPCINNGICRGCGVFEGCRLPQALSAKRAARES